MSGQPLDVPAVVRNKAAAAGALTWLTDLPDLVSEIEREWRITVGRASPDPTEAFVAQAVTHDGVDVVVKLLVPRGDAAAHEITVLRHAAGDGCVELLRSDETRGALLLERLGPALHDLALPLDRRLEILCAAAQRIWRPAAGLGLPTGAAKGHWLVEFIIGLWEELDRPCSDAAVAHALACADRRIAAHDDERAVLVHGDVHEWNALRSSDGFKLIDPDGVELQPIGREMLATADQLALSDG